MLRHIITKRFELMNISTKQAVGFIIGILVVILCVMIVLSQNKQTASLDQNSDAYGQQDQSGTTSAPVETTKPASSGTTKPAPKPVTPTTPAPTAGTYTAAQVATHASASNCWTIVNGSVYNVTSWISQHPGGKQAIVSMCGRDASASFDSQHGGQRRPESELASFKIGVLAK